jgi:hypothetical protein
MCGEYPPWSSRMVRKTPILAILALPVLGCTPQNAELVSGSYRGFLHEGTSFSVQKESVALGEFDEFYNLDCRDLSDTPDTNEDGTNKDERERLRLEPKQEVCSGSEKQEKRGELSFPVEAEGWLNEGAYHVVGGQMEPWRGEAIMTSEGHFQVTFHQKIPGGEDMRFAFSVDPNFQPQQCVEDAEGTVGMVNIDGDWLGGWSQDLTDMSEDDDLHPVFAQYSDHFDGTMYYANARAFQFDPDNTEDTWSLPLEWRAGFTTGKFADEFFHARTTRYGDPAIYASFESDDGGQPTTDQLYYCGETGNCNELCNTVNDVADTVAAEMALAGPDGPAYADEASEDLEWYRPLVHCNTWRDTDLDGELEPGPDGRPPGLDGWVGLHYNWLIIDPSSTLEEGGSASGVFNFVYDGDESRSRFFIQGEFSVDKIKNDRWTSDDIEAIKLAQNGTQLCQ